MVQVEALGCPPLCPCRAGPTADGEHAGSPRRFQGHVTRDAIDADYESNIISTCRSERDCDLACILFLRRVCEAVSRMEDRQVVYILNIPLLKVGVDAESLAEIMQRVESFRLRLGDWRDSWASRQCPKTDEGTTGILQSDSLRIGIRRREVEQ